MTDPFSNCLDDLRQYVSKPGFRYRPPKVPNAPPSIRAIVTEAAILNDVHVDEIYGRSRKRDVVEARRTAIFLIRARTGASFPRIGDWLGLDHGTVIVAYRKATGDPRYESRLAKCKEWHLKRACREKEIAT